MSAWTEHGPRLGIALRRQAGRWLSGRASAAPAVPGHRRRAAAGGVDTPARGLARRLPFSLALVGLALGLTALAGAMLGLLAWQQKRALSRELLEDAMARTARLAAAHTERFLRDAESAVRLGPELVAQGFLDPASEGDLERFTLAVLRAHPQLAWVSYGDRDDRFVGAWRDSAGRVYLNRSGPRGDRIYLEEDRVLPDGRRQPVRRSDDHGYRPRERPYFQLAERRRAVAWTEPYEFYAGGGPGISAVAPVLDATGAVRGVFTVDLSLDGLGEFLDGLRVSPRGGVIVATRGGVLVAGPRRGAGAPRSAPDSMLLARMADTAPEAERSFWIRHGSERVLGRSVPLAVGETPWGVLVTVPERDFTEPVETVARRIAGLGVVGLGLVAAAGVVAARRLGRPLRRLAARAWRIGPAREEAAPPRPRDEIGALTHMLHTAARATRDRALARDLLGRYVSPELAEQWLREPGRSRPMAELREVAILMSDLRGFSALSERLAPEAVFDLLNRYLERMTEVILAHDGSIDAFIGDGILVVFGAPVRRADDAARAVRCAWAMQDALTALNTENRTRGLPELGMGIGLHAGVVVAGTIGGRDRAAYTVVGSVVNRASRIVDLARAGEVLLSDAMLARAAGLARVGLARRARVKGVAARLTVYPLLGLAAPREQAPDEQGLLGPRRDPPVAWPILTA